MESFEKCFKYVVFTACSGDAFHCDGTKCLLASKKCDGVRDCYDGTDEDNCIEGKLNIIMIGEFLSFLWIRKQNHTPFFGHV